MVNPRRNILRPILIKWGKIKYKVRILKAAREKQKKKNKKKKPTRECHKAISWFFSRNSAGQKGVAGYIYSDERENPTSKIALPSKDLIQLRWRNQKLYRQVKTCLCSESNGFSSSHVWVWELGHKEGLAPKNWCFQTAVLVKTLESPLDYKEIKPVNPKGNQTWLFTGRTNDEAEAPILWPLNVKSWLIGKDLDTGKDWRQEEKGMTEDAMVGWHPRLDAHEFEQAKGDSDGQWRMACWSPWGLKE